MLNIILRTCSESGAPNYTGTAQRICGNDRALMIKKCLVSLIQSINESRDDIQLTVLDDHSRPDFVQELARLLRRCKKPTELISLEETGFNASAYQQFMRAREAEDMVYTVEDDYLHTKNALSEMMQVYTHFRSLSGEKEVAIYPFDCPDRYREGHARACRMFHFNNRYWRTNTASANTLFTHSSVFRTYWSLFRSLALEYPKKDESDTINRLYDNTVDVSGPVCLVTPMPSLAVHLSYEQILPIETEMFDWRKTWDAIDV